MLIKRYYHLSLSASYNLAQCCYFMPPFHDFMATSKLGIEENK